MNEHQTLIGRSFQKYPAASPRFGTSKSQRTEVLIEAGTSLITLPDVSLGWS